MSGLTSLTTLALSYTTVTDLSAELALQQEFAVGIVTYQTGITPPMIEAYTAGDPNLKRLLLRLEEEGILVRGVHIERKRSVLRVAHEARAAILAALEDA